MPRRRRDGSGSEIIRGEPTSRIHRSPRISSRDTFSWRDEDKTHEYETTHARDRYEYEYEYETSRVVGVAPRVSSQLDDATEARASFRRRAPLVAAARDEGRTRKVGTQGRHPRGHPGRHPGLFAAFPRRVERRASSCVSAPSASAVPAVVSRTARHGRGAVDDGDSPTPRAE